MERNEILKKAHAERVDERELQVKDISVQCECKERGKYGNVINCG